MGLLDRVITGVEAAPPRLVVYGGEGIGKSSLAARAPNPVFIQTEDGLRQIATSKLPLCRTYDDFEMQLAAVRLDDHQFDTLVIDSLDWLEKLIWADVCRKFNVSHIEKADGGYARGYKHALTQWREVIDGLDAANNRGMAIVLIAHAKVQRFEDPESSPYDRYTLALHRDADDLVREWVDAVLFATAKKRTVTEEVGFNKTRTTAKAVGLEGGERILRAIGSPACVAKNRYGMPGELPLSWDELAKFLN